jgi:hypothetical protein
MQVANWKATIVDDRYPGGLTISGMVAISEPADRVTVGSITYNDGVRTYVFQPSSFQWFDAAWLPIPKPAWVN